MKRSNIQRSLKYGMGVFISVLSLSAGLSGGHHALAAQGAHDDIGGCRNYAAVMITSQGTNEVLTAPNVMFSNGVPIRLGIANGGVNQTWNLAPIASNGDSCLYRIISSATGTALTVSKAPHVGKVKVHGHSAPHASAVLPQSVFLSGNTGGIGSNQLWSIVPIFGANFQNGFGAGANPSANYHYPYKIVSMNKMVLDVSGGVAGPFGFSAPTVTLSPDSGGFTQAWSFSSANSRVPGHLLERSTFAP